MSEAKFPKILFILLIGGIGVQTKAANLAILEFVISECERFTIGDKIFDGNGGNGYGFDALPAGISLFEYKSDSENCKNEETYALPKWNGLGEATAFMSSISEYKIFLSSDTSRVACMAKNSLVSVRCIKN